MTRQGLNRSLRPTRRPVAKKFKGKELEQIKAFVNLIDGELERFVKAIMGFKSPGKVKRLSHQLLPKLKDH
jgi:hypothetical protein